MSEIDRERARWEDGEELRIYDEINDLYGTGYEPVFKE